MVRRASRLVTVSALLVLASEAILAGAASAHPLGRFSTNRFAGLEFTTQALTIHYVVDMAEIRTFQELDAIDANRDEHIAPPELQAFSERTARQLIAGVQVAADGNELLPLETVGSSADLRPGQGALQTLRLEIDYRTALPAPEAEISFLDLNYASLLGWKEVIAYTSGDQGIESSTVPRTSASNELLDYPADRLSSPLNVTSAVVRIAPDAPSRAAAEADEGSPEETSGLEEALASVVEREITPAALALAFVLALGAGALHALGPGHGKTIMAAYLVGADGRLRHAVVIGIAVSLMHTLSVVALGFVTLWASSVFEPAKVYPWLALASALAVLGLGGWLLYRRASSISSRGHDHDHDHTHSHDPPPATSEGSLVSKRGLGAIALSGGLLPSPAALVVLLSAIALGRVVLGLALVAAFSIGLAAALAAVGIVVLRTRSFTAGRLGHRTARWLPIASAACVVVLGIVLAVRAVASF